MKTYTGQTGYVYQYYFVGKRVAMPDDPDAPAIEYIFDVTADRKTIFAVSVFLKQSALDEWKAAHARALTDPEQYAAAKLRLFQGFDEVDKMQASGRRLAIEGTAIESLLEQLGVD
ncbi:MAG: hypothetical protein HYX28_01745 [Candidatus Koribacter versatilis]|uniref:Uncharacterized protein n=1 Tax=Candidatus Korobacter versatilis TaxID=658062 RepID=A0A932EPY6_9BACT|nr:hypothetical protein [Candidatus Koribacter versatilis]